MPMGYTTVRNLSGLLLLAAAGLKAHRMLAEPIADGGFFASPWLLIAAVEFELFFGMWLISGVLPTPTWYAALACFGFFACVSFHKVILGHATCGCFGRVPINPWYAAMLDLAIVGSLLRWRPMPSTTQAQNCKLRVLTVFLVWLVIGAPAAVAMRGYVAAIPSDLGTIAGDGRMVVLEPSKWIGKPFPLLNYIDIRDQLRQGRWLVVLFHHDCGSCQQALPKYIDLVAKSRDNPTPFRVALIEMPPYSDEGQSPLSANTPCVVGRLSDEYEWFVKTPLVVTLSDSISHSVN